MLKKLMLIFTQISRALNKINFLKKKYFEPDDYK